MLDLLCIGEAMAELRSAPDGAGFVVGFAGDTYNTAVYAKRALGGAGKVGFLTRVGEDPLSAGLLAACRHEGLDTSHVQRDPARNVGIYSVTTDPAGERSFHYWRDQSAARQLFEDADTSLPPARIIYVSGITMAILSPTARSNLMGQLAQRQAQGCEIAYDSNYRPKLWEDQATARAVTARMWALCDLAFPSIDDEQALFGDVDENAVVTRFGQGSFTRCTIKRGERGPLALGLDPSTLPAFPPATKVVDTTAAGDSFNGGYFAARLTGKSEPECLLAGHQLASRVVGVSGAIG